MQASLTFARMNPHGTCSGALSARRNLTLLLGALPFVAAALAFPLPCELGAPSEPFSFAVLLVAVEDVVICFCFCLRCCVGVVLAAEVDIEVERAALGVAELRDSEANVEEEDGLKRIAPPCGGYTGITSTRPS